LLRNILALALAVANVSLAFFDLGFGILVCGRKCALVVTRHLIHLPIDYSTFRANPDSYSMTV
jgi:hypothetical protein